VRTWVLSIVHNQAIDRARRSKAKRLEAEIELAGEVPDGQDVYREVATSLDRERIGQALRSLPSEQRAAIELAYFGGYSHSEIAGLLRIPLGTVKGRLRLGLDKLRSILAEPALELRPE
jgi:RNA polymerase sigma-70 factor (ECF subfamily)